MTSRLSLPRRFPVAGAILVATLAALLAGSLATAQPAQPPAPPASADSRPAALLDDLKRLADTLGALHYLRSVCVAGEGQAWRTEMQTLIEAEGTSKEWREQMTGSFNRGFRAYQDVHRTCTPATESLIRRHMTDGLALARDMKLRFGD
jgi:uncharacterized protein (TIGR02301 family)